MLPISCHIAQAKQKQGWASPTRPSLFSRNLLPLHPCFDAFQKLFIATDKQGYRGAARNARGSKEVPAGQQNATAHKNGTIFKRKTFRFTHTTPPRYFRLSWDSSIVVGLGGSSPVAPWSVANAGPAAGGFRDHPFGSSDDPERLGRASAANASHTQRPPKYDDRCWSNQPSKQSR